MDKCMYNIHHILLSYSQCKKLGFLFMKIIMDIGYNVRKKKKKNITAAAPT
jgi:hypothetical protein